MAALWRGVLSSSHGVANTLHWPPIGVPVDDAAPRFVADLGAEGPGVYRLLRAGRRDVVRGFLDTLQNPKEAQEARLRVIVDEMKDSAFGRAHVLGSVRRLDDLRQAVPVRTHAELEPWLARVAHGERQVLTRSPVTMLLETSGTTGRPKHLPATAPWAESVAAAQALWVLKMVKDHPELGEGRALTVVSPVAHAQSPGGLPIGSNTGRMHAAQPWYVKARYPVPDRVFDLEPTELKWYTLLRFALQQSITSITTANPSTVLLLCRRLKEWAEPLSRDLADGTLRHGPAAMLDRWTRRRLSWRLRRRRPPTDWRPARIWPLKLVNCWKGGPAAYFTSRLPDALGGAVPIREVGITASEGYFAIPLGDDWPGGVMWAGGHVLEFVSDDGTPRWGWELEVGERVRLVITTEAGLCRYDLADTLEVVGRCGRLPVLRFVGKTGRWLNTTGEKVTEAQVARAVRTAAAETGAQLAGFCVRIRWSEVPDFEVVAEGTGVDDALARAFDRALRAENIEYDAKRKSERIGPAQVQAVSPGTFLRWREGRVADGAPEGQVKDPVIAATDVEWARVAQAAGLSS